MIKEKLAEEEILTFYLEAHLHSLRCVASDIEFESDTKLSPPSRTVVVLL